MEVVSVCGTLINVSAVLSISTVACVANTQVYSMKVATAGIAIAIVGVYTLVEI